MKVEKHDNALLWEIVRKMNDYKDIHPDDADYILRTKYGATPIEIKVPKSIERELNRKLKLLLDDKYMMMDIEGADLRGTVWESLKMGAKDFSHLRVFFSGYIWGYLKREFENLIRIKSDRELTDGNHLWFIDFIAERREYIEQTISLSVEHWRESMKTSMHEEE